MNKNTVIKLLTTVGKGLGLISSMGAIPMVSPEKGVIIFFIASLLKDVVNRVADFVDDGKINNSVGK